jgi:hypothetical protein
MFAVTFAAFVAAAIYACITYRQFSTARDANELAEKQFYVSNRPYLVALNFPIRGGRQTLSGKQYMFASVVWKNFGKTPAIGAVVRMCDVIIRDNPTPPALNCVVPEAPSSHYTTFGPEQFMKLVLAE